MAFNWKGALRAVAPALATALGGPADGAAISALAGLLLGKDTASEDELAARVQNLTADDVLKLKQADQAFAVEMAQIARAGDATEAQDRSSAREREVSSHDSWTPRVLAILMVGTFIYVVYCVTTGHIAQIKDPLVAGILGSVIGYTSAKTDTVYGYYFGGSYGSARKDITIAQQLAKK